MDEELLANLLDWLRIPSISTGEGSPEDLRAAAEHVCDLVRRAGGEAALDERFGGNHIHAPDESFRLESLELGSRASLELLSALAELPRA